MPEMRPFLLSLPERLQIVIIVDATVTSALAVAIATCAQFDLHQLAADAGLTTAVYAVLGNIYAVLLAFAVSGVWAEQELINSPKIQPIRSITSLLELKFS